MITLIGKDLAEEGLNFIFYGSSEICESCRFKASCIESLEEGRKYIIKNVKDIQQKCDLHDTGLVQSVEVEVADVETLVDTKKVFEGSTISFNPPDCDIECVFHHLCNPEGLKKGDKCTVIKDLGKHKGGCGKDFLLTKVVLSLN
ncbi:hypothetical protein MBCUT_10150 [Methanobrevibacter cuticularis]|uniref:UPF0179 protein MBCUT_10150 n=1 Tax=Methanobrevibacter cuticularis TaxID=47311 RepID=A0A166E0N9_9EURY|nr:UPF0179 family protein [Methanobrevibacter cuticularis]KZX16149.1 hypothetical protein MBCUT_10150 [Methanobrevibacter cuticularis]